MQSDPTLEFLRRLADESLWAVRRGVPVFEPHTRMGVGPDGKPKEIKVTAADLPEIAEEANRLERERGVVGLLTDRHTIRQRADGKGMEPVPEARTYGYQRNYRVGVYGPHAKPAILADWLLYPDRAEEVDRRPHRSVEYQPGAKLIRGTAIMANAPFLDLGMVAFRAGGEEIYLYAMGANVPDPTEKPTDAPKPDPKAAPEAEPKKEEGEQNTPEEEKLFEKCCRYMRTKYALDETWPAAKKPDAPTDQPKPTEGEEKPKEPITPMSTDKDTVAYAALQARVAGLEAEREIERCNTLLYSLEQSGYALSQEEKVKELKKLTAMPAADRDDRVKELKAIYAGRKVPEGRLELYAGPHEGLENANPLVAEPWYHKDAVAYMLASQGKVGYDAAVVHIKATKAK